MPDDRSMPDWDQRYQTDDLPWDTGTVEPELVAVLETPGFPRPQSVVDLGCGTGTNVVYSAQQGTDATGVDLSPKAIEIATAKARAAGIGNARFLVGDVLASALVPARSADFVFDRGCFHCISVDDRTLFAERVRDMLAAGGHWLNLSGNADELRPEGVEGPPQLRAAEIIAAVEPLFEIQHLRPMRFGPIRGGSAPLAWSCLLRRRG